MGQFDKFNKTVDLKQLKKDAEEIKKNGGTGEYNEVPAGAYVAKCERLEIRATKDGRPMLSSMFRIVKGDQKKRCIFMNRVLYGTKNDANMIASALGWIESLEPEIDAPIVFENYDQFADLVMDVAEDISELEYEVDYDETEFNSIHIGAVIE